MRKEIIIATIAGVTIGLLVAFGSWRVNSTLKNKFSEKTDSGSQIRDVSSKPENPSSDEFTINLLNIDDYDVVGSDTLKVAGITRPNSIIAISGELNDNIIKPSPNGSFEQEIELNSGINQILFRAYSPEGSYIEKLLTIVYSSEFEKEITAAAK